MSTDHISSENCLWYELNFITWRVSVASGSPSILRTQIYRQQIIPSMTKRDMVLALNNLEQMKGLRKRQVMKRFWSAFAHQVSMLSRITETEWTKVLLPSLIKKPVYVLNILAKMNRTWSQCVLASWVTFAATASGAKWVLMLDLFSMKYLPKVSILTFQVSSKYGNLGYNPSHCCILLEKNPTKRNIWVQRFSH